MRMRPNRDRAFTRGAFHLHCLGQPRCRTNCCLVHELLIAVYLRAHNSFVSELCIAVLKIPYRAFAHSRPARFRLMHVARHCGLSFSFLYFLDYDSGKFHCSPVRASYFPPLSKYEFGAILTINTIFRSRSFSSLLREF